MARMVCSSVCLLLITASTALAEPRIVHHRLEVAIVPAESSLRAVDELDIEGDGDLLLHLGVGFTWESIRQGTRRLEWEDMETDDRGIVTSYQIVDWDPSGPALVVSWSGRLPEFRGYKVSVIRSDLVELSGFCNWFPTVERQSQLESFTYSMELTMPRGWVVLSPTDEPFAAGTGGTMKFARESAPAGDVFICASPDFELHEFGGEGSPIKLYVPAGTDTEPILGDFEKVLTTCTDWFGEPAAADDIVAVISPRRDGAEWGYKRGAIWVTGDLFADYLLTHDWTIKGLKKSLAAHETIHTWFGESVSFEEAYLAEAVTQYVEVVLTAAMFAEPDLADRYFAWYFERFGETMQAVDTAISQLSADQNPYDYWYLKGSWVFWDLEAEVGRDALLAALADVHAHAMGGSISRDEFSAELGRSIHQDLQTFFRHWFDEPGFQPVHRVN